MVFRQKRGRHTWTQGQTHMNQEQERGWVGVCTANTNAQAAGADRNECKPVAAMAAATAPAATATAATTVVGAAAMGV